MTALKQSILTGAKTGFDITIKVFLFMIPISFGIMVLRHLGLIEMLSAPFAKLFHYFGLPGDAVVPYVTGVLVNGYSAIAVMATLPLTLKEITVLSAMILMAHNMPIESMIQKKAGANITLVIVTRLIISLITGFVLNLIITENGQTVMAKEIVQADFTFYEAFMVWLQNISFLLLKIAIIIISLTIFNKGLEHYGVLRKISTYLKPLMHVFGLSYNTSIQWLSANLFGLVYGAGVILSQDPKKLSRFELNKLHLSIGISHSLIQETMIFAVIGAPLFWITIPRILSAIAVVWLFRIACALTGLTLSKSDLA